MTPKSTPINNAITIEEDAKTRVFLKVPNTIIETGVPVLTKDSLR